MRIYMVLTVRYPTEKAYGVSVGNTARELKRLGYKVKIFSNSQFQGIDEYGNEVIQIRTWTSDVLKRISSRLSFHISQFIVAFKFIRKARREVLPELIWTRSFVVAAFSRCFFRTSRVIVEIHDTRNRLDQLFYRFLARDKNVSVGFPTIGNCEKFNRIKPSKRNFVLNNAAPLEFYELPRRVSLSVIRIGFVGKGQSNGQDNNLEMLVEGFSLLELENQNFQLVFIGLEEEYRILLEKARRRLKISENSVIFISHLNHTSLGQELSKLDIGVIPYGNSEYNNERFPIKIVEYAAAGVPILVSSIEAHLNILPKEAATFFQPNFTDFARAVIAISSDVTGRSKKVDYAKTWSKEFTYQKRVDKALESFGINL